MKFKTIISSILGIVFTGIGFGYQLTFETSLSSYLFNNSIPNLGINIDTNLNQYEF